MPENSAINVSAVSADIEISDVYGEQRLHSVSGDVSSEVYGADAEAESVSGDIELAGNNQATLTQLSSVSGDVDVFRLSGEIEATSVSGELSIVTALSNAPRATPLTATSFIAPSSSMAASSISKPSTVSVDLIFKGDVSARFDIETFNGSIRNCFGPKPERSNQYGPGRELKFSEGSGNSRVTIRTLNGGMTLCRD